jgi:hypothetical protein
MWQLIDSLATLSSIKLFEFVFLALVDDTSASTSLEICALFSYFRLHLSAPRVNKTFPN